MALPPNAYRTDERAILEHYELIASVGLPVTAYNNPIDTKTDLTPPILARLSAEGLHRRGEGVQRRRASLLRDRRTGAGSRPHDRHRRHRPRGRPGRCGRLGRRATRRFSRRPACGLYQASLAGDLATALPLYRQLHSGAPLGLQDRVHPGDQTRPGHDRAGWWHAAVRRVRRSRAEQEQDRSATPPRRSSTPGSSESMRSRVVYHAVDSSHRGYADARHHRRGRRPPRGDDVRSGANGSWPSVTTCAPCSCVEPRGHAAMSGAILQPPTRPDADFGVLYIEVSGCLPMCGHGTIGVATVLVETGMVEVSEPETVIRLDAPAGLVTARRPGRGRPGRGGHPRECRLVQPRPRRGGRGRGVRARCATTSPMAATSTPS
jgi:hypothetical protein